MASKTMVEKNEKAESPAKLGPVSKAGIRGLLQLARVVVWGGVATIAFTFLCFSAVPSIVLWCAQEAGVTPESTAVYVAITVGAPMIFSSVTFGIAFVSGLRSLWTHLGDLARRAGLLLKLDEE